MRHLAGTFIAFDGGEGCGKSTQAAMLKAAIEAHGLTVLSVRDPGTTRLGEAIRRILLDPDNTEMGMRCEMLLYMAARAQMMHETIGPALLRGEVVITDRFISSTLAYQLGGDGLTADEIRAVGDVAVKCRWPDLTIICDLPLEISRQRVRAKFEHTTRTLFGEEKVTVVKDRIEQRPPEYHAKVREAYLSQARADAKRYRVVDASRSPEEVHADVVKLLEAMA
jgi:dTMP kinase